MAAGAAIFACSSVSIDYALRTMAATLTNPRAIDHGPAERHLFIAVSAEKHFASRPVGYPMP
jgi:hypothetical protein